MTLRELSPAPTVEVLTPDFQGNWTALHTVMTAGPDVFNHNVETTPRLYRALRPGADYRRSLEMLQRAKQFRPSVVTKSGFMVGLGEQRHEVLSVMRDLLRAGCDMLTIGQYLSPSPQHYPVRQFIPPAIFSEYRQMARDEGFRFVASSPLTRSSYRADELLPGNFQRRAPDENHHHRKAHRNRPGFGRACSPASAHAKEIF
jgi:lipoic acid synthetase